MNSKVTIINLIETIEMFFRETAKSCKKTSTVQRPFHYYVFSSCRGNMSAELFPSNGCCTVACLHNCYLAMSLHTEIYYSDIDTTDRTEQVLTRAGRRVEVVAPLSQGRTAAVQCGLFTHKSVPVILEPPCSIGEGTGVAVTLQFSTWEVFVSNLGRYTFSIYMPE
jgi:hypothetical protein